MQTNSKGKSWKDVWSKKYTEHKNHKWLHVQDGFDNLNYSQWKKLCGFFLNIIDIRNTDDVLEVGCGSGAFAREIQTYKSISGVDYSSEAIENIKQNIPEKEGEEGGWYHSEANSLPFKNNSFDKIICFSVFFYFDNYKYASQTLEEMLRVLRLDGEILIGEVSDINKKNIATKLRGESKKVRQNRALVSSNFEHLYYPVDFFKKFAADNNLDVRIIDENVPELSFYESSSYRFSVLLTTRI